MIIASSIAFLKSEGIMVHYGRWLIPGYPHGIWFDLRSTYYDLHTWKEEFNRLIGIKLSNYNDGLEDDIIVYGFIVAKFFIEVFFFYFTILILFYFILFYFILFFVFFSQFKIFNYFLVFTSSSSRR